MLRSMYSGIAGMKANQTKLDVIGNNISNVGTTAFKASRATFQDTLYQTVKSSMSPNNNQGGVNAQQVGLGVQLASIDTIMTNGMMQPTGRALDVAIDGDGFFMVSSGPTVFGDKTLQVSQRAGAHNITEQSLATSGSQLMYSRDGAFVLDEEGNLLTADGYRVMGYSLTNDDNGIDASGLSPAEESIGDLNFSFGPGSQLNGYSIALGEVGPGTVTSATVDKVSKKIILSGDFSTNSTLNSDQVESALNKGISAAGISQRINVKGNIPRYANLGSDQILGGSDDTAPSSLNFLGVNFKFEPGSKLNGYSFKLGKVSDPATTADITGKVITINGDFSNGTVTALDIINAVNTKLDSVGGFNKLSSDYTGSVTSGLSQLKDTFDSTGNNGSAPTAVTAAGYGITFTGKSSALNGFKITVADDKTKTPSVTVDRSQNTITIVGDLAGAGVNSGTPYSAAQLQTDLNNKLKQSGIDPTVLTTTVGGSFTGAANSTTTVTVDNAGKEFTAPTTVDFLGLKVTLPKGSTFNGYTIKAGDLNATVTNVNVDTATNTITVDGPFLQGTVTATDLANQLNSKLTPAPVAPNLAAVTGNLTSLSYQSDIIDGGSDLKAPGTVTVDGMTFAPVPGGSLNGYTVRMGTVTAGTKTSADVDEKSKTITINGDFQTFGATDVATIQNAVKKALAGKSISQGITVSGVPGLVQGETQRTSGGTPVQSIDTDGTIEYVDGTKDLKAYDEKLKTLRIPESVKVPGTSETLKVKSYTIDKTGVIKAVLEDGSVAALGQIAIAGFKNPEGLSKLGKNLYAQSANSGEATVKSGLETKGEDNSQGFGDTVQGMLEMSNVDLAEQFTNMIVTNRAFQASGKMITTGDEVLQDIINLKR
ncbi:flagellar hook-basal body complex protein [Clostridium sp. YIM B02551]|uniref:flagellar hook-basal body complex protein n=1 Tax=Clostridium sp. YIM B02551 TaxID=2910679 RepID=UPI001EEC233B|nr:flagellar hook-basal body complex protein [Clostridium sp. YIM B02551]